MNKGIYIDSYHTEAVVGISLRLRLVNFTKTPQYSIFAFCYCYIRRPSISGMIFAVKNVVLYVQIYGMYIYIYMVKKT